MTYKLPVDHRLTSLSFKDYDRSMVRKIESVIFKDTKGNPVVDVIYSPVDLLYERAQKVGKERHGTDGKSIRYPLIGLYRGSDMRLSDQNNAVTGHRKVPFTVTYRDDSTNELVQRSYQVLFIDIPYQIDVYGQDETEALILLHELLFLFKRDPWFTLPKYISDNVPEELKERVLYIGTSLDTSITDTSNLEEETNTGKIYRYTINVMINDAVLMRDVKDYMVTDTEIELEVLDD